MERACLIILFCISVVGGSGFAAFEGGCYLLLRVMIITWISVELVTCRARGAIMTYCTSFEYKRIYPIMLRCYSRASVKGYNPPPPVPMFEAPQTAL
jgi:hypothetical protein